MNNEKGNTSKKKTGLWMIRYHISIVLVIILVLVETGCSNNLTSDKWEGNPDAETQTFANGDIVYTPGSDHAVVDSERTIMYYNNLLLVFTEYDLSDAEIDVLEQVVDGEVVGSVSGYIHALQIKVKDSTLAELEDMAAVLMENEQVMYAYSEYPVQVMSIEEDRNPWTDSDILLSERGNEEEPDGYDWWAEAIGAYTAWEYSDLCQEIKVGIADNGFYTEHEDLKGQITLVSNYNSVADHGTHVAGIIGALNNDKGIRGIADTAKLYCADLWIEDASESYHTLAEFLAVVNYMAECGVKVINNSWGCYTSSIESFMQEKYGTFYLVHQLFAQNEYETWLEQRMNQDLVPTAEASIVMISQLIDSGYEDIIFVQAAGNGYDNGYEGVDAKYSGFFSGITESLCSSMDESLLKKLNEKNI